MSYTPIYGFGGAVTVVTLIGYDKEITRLAFAQSGTVY
jgi:hypothetical protein